MGIWKEVDVTTAYENGSLTAIDPPLKERSTLGELATCKAGHVWPTAISRRVVLQKGMY